MTLTKFYCLDCGRATEKGILICQECMKAKTDGMASVLAECLADPLGLLYFQKFQGLTHVRTRVYQYRSDRSTGKNGFIAGYTSVFPCNKDTPPYQHSEWGIEIARDVFVCYSSTTRNRTDADVKSNGVRKILEKDLLNHPENWDIFEKVVTIDEAIGQLLRAEYVNRTGTKYDWGGIMGFGGLWVFNDPLKWYCSEEVYYIIFDERKKTVSPRHLTVYILAEGFVLVRAGTKAFAA